MKTIENNNGNNREHNTAISLSNLNAHKAEGYLLACPCWYYSVTNSVKREMGQN